MTLTVGCCSGAIASRFAPSDPTTANVSCGPFTHWIGQSIYLRFFFHKRALSDKELRQITECDGTRVVALVATVESGSTGSHRRTGSVREARDGAHVAFAVEEDFQGRGIATRLLRRLVRIGRDQGISHFEADVLAENLPMLQVFRRSGLPVEESDEDGVVHLTLAIGDAHRRAGAPEHRAIQTEERPFAHHS